MPNKSYQEYQQELKNCLATNWYPGKKTSEFLANFLNDTAIEKQQKYKLLTENENVYQLGMVLIKNNFPNALSDLLKFILLDCYALGSLQNLVHSPANLEILLFIDDKNVLETCLQYLIQLIETNPDDKDIIFALLSMQDKVNSYTLLQSIATLGINKTFFELLNHYQGKEWSNKLLNLLTTINTNGNNYASEFIIHKPNRDEIDAFFNLVARLIDQGGDKDLAYKLMVNYVSKGYNFYSSIFYNYHDHLIRLIDFIYACGKAAFSSNPRNLKSDSKYQNAILKNLCDVLITPLGQRYYIEANNPNSWLGKLLRFNGGNLKPLEIAYNKLPDDIK
jgi:hypothetical protein